MVLRQAVGDHVPGHLRADEHVRAGHAALRRRRTVRDFADVGFDLEGLAPDGTLRVVVGHGMLDELDPDRTSQVTVRRAPLDEALARVNGAQLSQLMFPSFAPSENDEVIATGVAASPAAQRAPGTEPGHAARRARRHAPGHAMVGKVGQRMAQCGQLPIQDRQHPRLGRVRADGSACLPRRWS